LELILADDYNREYVSKANATKNGKFLIFGSLKIWTNLVENAFNFIRNGTYDLMPAFFDKEVSVHGGGLESTNPIYEVRFSHKMVVESC
jgi:hypothetical protein